MGISIKRIWIERSVLLIAGAVAAVLVRKVTDGGRNSPVVTNPVGTTYLQGGSLATGVAPNGTSVPNVPGVAVAATLGPAALIECPDHDGVLIADGLGNVQSVTSFPVPGPITLIPEFHDCQRLPLSDAKFGPLAAILASVSDTSTVPPLPTLDSAAAYILSGDVYLPLGIATGGNCLYLWGNPTSEARMVPVGGDHERCRKPLAAGSTEGEQLLVNIVPDLPGSLTGPLPTGARWDMDPDTRITYATLRCGEKWCEVGPKNGWTSSLTYDVEGTARFRAVHGFKGWYDEQNLAVPAPTGETPIHVPSFVGTIIPDTLLLIDSTWAPYKDNWRPTVRVQLWEDIPSYGNGYGFKKGVFPGSVNNVSLCHGTCEGVPAGLSCPSGSPIPSPDGVPSPEGEPTPTPLYARIEGPNSEPPKFHCVQYKKHTLHGAPHSARWRWPKEKQQVPIVLAPSSNVMMGFGVGEAIFPPRLLQSGGILIGLWHWCPDGCCTIW